MSSVPCASLLRCTGFAPAACWLLPSSTEEQCVRNGRSGLCAGKLGSPGESAWEHDRLSGTVRGVTVLPLACAAHDEWSSACATKGTAIVVYIVRGKEDVANETHLHS
eukprot:1157130-Pelagomonas_calceolata.AAC.3